MLGTTAGTEDLDKEFTASGEIGKKQLVSTPHSKCRGESLQLEQGS